MNTINFIDHNGLRQTHRLLLYSTSTACTPLCGAKVCIVRHHNGTVTAGSVFARQRCGTVPTPSGLQEYSALFLSRHFEIQSSFK